MGFKEMLGEAFKIANSISYNVKIYSRDDDDNKEQLSMTYLELGLYLTTNCDKIMRVDILIIGE